jgi:hypothetical protein
MPCWKNEELQKPAYAQILSASSSCSSLRLSALRTYSNSMVARLTELLQKFHSVRIKTAALIMRFLCLDCNFFEVDISKLIPPLDRVNYRMCSQLFNRRYVLQKLGAYEVSFDKRANFGFADIGKHVLGKNKVLIDNMWFIGHFYHDGHKQNKCEIREGAKVVDYLYLENIIQKMPKLCPFSVYGCERST